MDDARRPAPPTGLPLAPSRPPGSSPGRPEASAPRTPRTPRETSAAAWRSAAGDPELAALVRVAAAVTGATSASVNLLDGSEQCELAAHEIVLGTTPVADSMCVVRIAEGRTVHVPDAAADPDYAGVPWVDGRWARVRLYASVPLVPTAGGAPLGTLCVFDDEPRHLTAPQLARLEDLALAVTALLERRREAQVSARLAQEADEQRDLAELVIGELAARSEDIEERSELIEAVLATVDVAVVACGPDGRLTLFNRTARQWHGMDVDTAVDPEQLADRYALFEADGTTPLVAERIPLVRALREGVEVAGQEIVIAPAGQPARTVSVSGRALHRADGTALGAVVVMADVTADRAQRRLVEEAHQQVRDRGALLEREVASRRAAQDQLAAANTELQRLLLVDGLTRLANRPCLDDHLARQSSAHARRGTPLSVLMVDVDHFKAYNDTHGHLAGDACLRRVADVLADAAERGGDLVARYGGEEFAVVLDDTDAAGATVVARRLVEAVRAAQLPHGGPGAGGRVTISVGAATWPGAGHPGAGARTLGRGGSGLGADLSATALLAAADAALYAAKSAGRDTARHADDLVPPPVPSTSLSAVATATATAGPAVRPAARGAHPAAALPASDEPPASGGRPAGGRPSVPGPRRR
ncbi:diguanylate cyclase domain-containing protein [uncultured Pseudokineococcus sp.]|uniref:diguanylate cyclase domain-containing protein n=1 Tax=uncultured Pseudokineococcus sp. TaxID=1642928 RepID=UPI00261BC414|nr:diguanylate cyclase [uncultured Pseudokineococcus sp.]